MQVEEPGSGDASGSAAGVPGPPSRVSHALFLSASFSLLIATYLAIFFLVSYGTGALGVPIHYWSAVAAAAGSTFVTVRLMEHGRWSIGFFVAPRLAATEAVLGLLFGAALIGAADVLVTATTASRHAAGKGLPWLELALIYIPAAVHEEVLFRGYIYQRIREVSRVAAIASTSLVFAALHAGNSGVSGIALLNVLGGGVLLALAYERYRRLWFPIGLHLAWNVMSGAVLGYAVSGYEPRLSLLRMLRNGPDLLTGGAFGIEGSVYAVAVEVAGIALLLSARRTRDV